jgi:DNA invertase Pin-like site-specific DNA recombinase
MIVGYARTSTTSQIAGLEAQVRELSEAGCDKISPCVREVAVRIGSEPQGATDDGHGTVWAEV